MSSSRNLEEVAELKEKTQAIREKDETEEPSLWTNSSQAGEDDGNHHSPRPCNFNGQARRLISWWVIQNLRRQAQPETGLTL